MFMGIFKRLYRIASTYDRFRKVYNKLEDKGYSLFIRQKSGEDVHSELVRYRKNLKKVDSLYSKWKC